MGGVGRNAMNKRGTVSRGKPMCSGGVFLSRGSKRLTEGRKRCIYEPIGGQKGHWEKKVRNVYCYFYRQNGRSLKWGVKLSKKISEEEKKRRKHLNRGDE